MTTYLVERYLPGRDRDWLEEALGRLPEHRTELRISARPISLGRSCFCRFEASDAEDVRRQRASRVPFARIVAASELAGVQAESSQRRRFSMKRFLALMLAVAVTGGFAVASQARTAGGARRQVGVELTYTKWFAHGFPNMAGEFSGDIVGRFGGAVLERSVPPTLRRPHGGL